MIANLTDELELMPQDDLRVIVEWHNRIGRFLEDMRSEVLDDIIECCAEADEASTRATLRLIAAERAHRRAACAEWLAKCEPLSSA